MFACTLLGVVCHFLRCHNTYNLFEKQNVRKNIYGQNIDGEDSNDMLHVIVGVHKDTKYLNYFSQCRELNRNNFRIL